ncbi:cabeza [Carabus blaptoides fortunei]
MITQFWFQSSGGRGGFKGGYGSGGEMVVQEDTVFVSGIDPAFTEEDIAQHFGAIGVIKIDKRSMKPKIWLYKDKVSGRSKEMTEVAVAAVDLAEDVAVTAEVEEVVVAVVQCEEETEDPEIIDIDRIRNKFNCDYIVWMV